MEFLRDSVYYSIHIMRALNQNFTSFSILGISMLVALVLMQHSNLRLENGIDFMVENYYIHKI